VQQNEMRKSDLNLIDLAIKRSNAEQLAMRNIQRQLHHHLNVLTPAQRKWAAHIVARPLNPEQRARERAAHQADANMQAQASRDHIDVQHALSRELPIAQRIEFEGLLSQLPLTKAQRKSVHDVLKRNRIERKAALRMSATPLSVLERIAAAKQKRSDHARAAV